MDIRGFILAFVFLVAQVLPQVSIAQNSVPYFPETPVLNPLYTNAEGTLTIDKNVDPLTKKQLLSDLQSLFAIQTEYANSLHIQKFNGFDGVSYKKFFYRLVDHIAFDSTDDSGTVAYVGMELFKVYITKAYVSSKTPLIGRLGLLLHEANHSDDDHNFWNHSICPTPFKNESGQEIKSIFTGLSLEGLDACDDQLFGSYSTSVLFLNNVADYCQNCSQKSKWDAQIYAEDQSERIISKTVVGQLKKDRLKKVKKNAPNRKPYDRHNHIAPHTVTNS